MPWPRTEYVDPIALRRAWMRGMVGLTLAATTLFAQGIARAAETEMIVPGGQLDPAYRDADVYIGTPVAAMPPRGRACALARRYVELINLGDYPGVAALYADDATFLEPMRPTLRGRAQIDEFYTRRIGSMKPQLIAVSYLGSEPECAVTLTRRIDLAGAPRYVLVSVDQFLVDAKGKIRSMVAFARPARGQ